MNKADKRQRSIRNKLMAAVAMLLVASIMTVTTTYAWFTLSTAPEVQGITTTVGANGNLEIALSPSSGIYSEISSTVNDGAIQDWTKKNLTWGNLLDLSDKSYALEDIVLLPSRLNINAGTETSAATLAGSPLKIPMYGSDGRISQLDGTKVTYGSLDTTLDSFIANLVTQSYGVRAMGTSSNRSDTEINFTNALANLETNRTTAKNTVTNALNTYGNALAEVALKHAGGDDTQYNYKPHVADLVAIMDELEAASAAVEEGLYNALLALASSNIKTTDGALFADTKMTVENADGTTREVKLYEYMKLNKDGGVPLTTAWEAMQQKVNLATIQAAFPELVDAYNTWKETDAAVGSTTAKVDALAAMETVAWADMSAALNGLMNIDKLTINGKSIDEAKANAGSLMTGSGISLEMNDGSGVIADFGKLTGNISSQVILGDVFLQSISLKDAKINLVTTSQPAKGALMTQVRVVIAATGAAAETPADGGEPVVKKNVLDVTYGYVLDFVFRTNAANSSLLLQNEGAQRIYGDSENTATKGNGSTMTFNGTYANLESLISMMSGIRVVFTNTQGDSTDVYGIAKIKFDDSPFIMALTEATREATAGTDGKYTLNYTTAADAEPANTTLYLDADEDENGVITSTLALADLGIPEGDEVTANRYVTNVEAVEDVNGNITHYIWTVKTAKWYTETVTIKDTEGKVVSEVTTVKIAQDADKNNLYFEDVVFNAEGGLVGTITDKSYSNAVEVEGSTTENIEDGANNIIGTQTTTIKYGVTTYDETKHAPKYYVVKDQALQLEGNLYLYNYEVAPEKITVDGEQVNNINAGKLTFSDVKSVQTLTALDQNVPTGVSALVYLDGDYIDNSDVTNSSNGISNTGTLNLQFASSADLVPMQNTDLRDGAEYKGKFANSTSHGVYYLNGLSAGEIDTTQEFKVNSGIDYTFLMRVDSNATVTYQVGADGPSVPLTGQETVVTLLGLSAKVMSYTIPGSAITGDVTITIN